MAKASIPVYDICTIDQMAQKDLLIERFGAYLEKHYQHLHRPHRHSFYHLVLFTKGKGGHIIDFKKFPVRPLQIYFMIPGQVHSWHFEGEVDGYIVHFNEVLFTTFLQNGHYLDRFYFFQGNAEDGICQLPVSANSQVTSLFEAMLAEVGESKEQNLDLIRLKLLELFITVDRSCTSRKGKNVPQQKLTLLRSFQNLIDKQFRTIRLPKEYADLLYVTSNHLNALCQDLVGKTAGDLIRDRVLLEAKRLLTNADMTVTEIAYDLNFQDNSYFNRFFKKNVGVTPDEFRKNFIQQ
ncbi:transcriptional regulator, AraC family [Cnuella takakiae]|uniref:Transcriptional regulator, AraC family n=1 Tax=Cnuella takakiae TaxID=1302690 RepID=A0A1M4Z8E0_9BACT|nr:AraC family transcriptional regulator [Cnuella takakiae]OLY94296.1 AraC family transcriptional regulator [Cnuella takakiae]SHF14218.1 transcriptional regulator, AraC family [Cnuella takakiae]